MRELTGGLGADVVYDPVGGDAFDQALRAVNWEARMLVIGFAAGRIQAVPANLILVKNISVIGVVWGAQAERDPVLISRNLAELLRWWEAGRLKPCIAEDLSAGRGRRGDGGAAVAPASPARSCWRSRTAPVMGGAALCPSTVRWRRMGRAQRSPSACQSIAMIPADSPCASRR